MRPALLAACVALSWGAALAAQQSGLALPAVAAPQPGATTRPSARSTTSRTSQPLLDARCGECHNGTKRKGGLALATYADILDGGKDGPIVQPGRSADSMLIHRLTGAGDEEQMPKDDPPLPPAEIALITRWIDEGVRETPTSAAGAGAVGRAARRSIVRPCPPRPGPTGRRRPIASSPITCSATARRSRR